MNVDDYKDAWRTAHPRLATDPDRLLDELRRDDRRFASVLFWRDVREVGVGLLMVPLWIHLGTRQGSPWTWYLTIPVLLWIAGYLLVHRIRHKRPPPGPDEPLRRCLAGSLKQLEHQVRLLRSVIWWALLPMALAMLAFFGQNAWRERGGGWWTVLAISEVTALGLGVLGAFYWLNLHVVRTDLEPRRRELQALLSSLEDEPPAAV